MSEERKTVQLREGRYSCVRELNRIEHASGSDIHQPPPQCSFWQTHDTSRPGLTCPMSNRYSGNSGGKGVSAH